MKLSNKEMVLRLQTIRLKHALTNRAFEEVIQFVALLTDDLGGPLGSLYKFEKYYNIITPSEEIRRYVFCCSCYQHYEEAKAPEACVCGTRIVRDDNKFVYTSLKQSLRCLMETEETRTNILKFTAEQKNRCSDFYGSKRYDELKKMYYSRCGLDHTFTNIISFLTLCINIDGVEVFKSSSKSLYPAMISVNEMSPFMRRQNIIVPLLFTATKSVPFSPNVMSIMIDDLIDIEINGVDWLYQGKIQNTKFYAGTLCVDAPVKSKLLAIPSHSAKDGCPIGNCEGTWMPKGKGGATCFIGTESGKPRESDESESILCRIPALQGVVFKAVALDSLHGIYIGVVKYLMDIVFFDAKFAIKSTRDDRIKVANKILDSVKSPFFVERGPRNLNDCKRWKAHEWRNMLFFFSVPIMDSLREEGLVHPLVASHWFNLALGTSLLNQTEVTQTDIDMASKALSIFVKDMGSFYGDGCMTYNVHLLLHLAETVDYLGPLWSTSMFKFEGYNRMIINSFNGSNCVEEQVAKRLSQRRVMQLLQEEVEESNPFSPVLEHSIYVRERKRVRYSNPGNCDGQHFVTLRHLHPDLNLYQLCSFKKVEINSRTFTTYSFSEKNCFMYSLKFRCFGRIEGLYVNSVTHNVYVVFTQIVSSASNKLPHAMFQCALSGRYYSDHLKDCKAAILVPSYSDNGFTMCYRLNNFESS